jgi:hypothetical protein
MTPHRTDAEEGTAMTVRTEPSPSELDRTVSAVADYARLAADAAAAAISLTRGRSRVLRNGNTPSAGDDPQFQRALGSTASRAALVGEAARSLARRAGEGDVTDAEAQLLLVAVAEQSRSVVRSMFDSLGASASRAARPLERPARVRGARRHPGPHDRERRRRLSDARSQEPRCA